MVTKENIENKKPKDLIENRKTLDYAFEYHMIPDYYSNFDTTKGKWQIEVHIPGVKKEDITLRILPDFYDIQAKRSNKEIYSLTEYFPFDISPESVKAQYNNGLLLIQGSAKNLMENEFIVKIE